jgi:hypothetical protein
MEDREMSTREEEFVAIENDINTKLREMGGLREFFGSGHGVDVVAMLYSWIEREVAPHQQRFGRRLRYTVEAFPDGRFRFAIKGFVSENDLE